MASGVYTLITPQGGWHVVNEALTAPEGVHTAWLVHSVPSFPPEQQYNQEITDLKQPVLVSQPKRRRGPGGTLPGPAMLIPELCYLTGAWRSSIRSSLATPSWGFCSSADWLSPALLWLQA